MDNPKISVIVPVYNVEQYLPRCIDSILAQTFTDFELLLIDDGSTDSSGDICDEYAKKDNRIRVFHKENGGVSSARNLGLNNAKGEWIGFIDSDDWIELNCFSVLLEKRNIADLIFFGCNFIYPDNSITVYKPTYFHSLERTKIEKCLSALKVNLQAFEYLGYTWNKLFRKSIIDKYNLSFVEGLTLREDELFTLSYARYIGSIRVLSFPLYNYRVLNTGLTHKIKSKEEYFLFINQLIIILHEYQDEQLILYEDNMILYYYFRALNVDKIFTKSWFILLKKLIAKGRYLKRRNTIRNKKMRLLFKYNCKICQYALVIIANFIVKK